MTLTTSLRHGLTHVLRWLPAAAVAMALATQASAQLTTVGPGAFSASATVLTFEDLSGSDNAALPTYKGVTLDGGTIVQLYSDYGSGLVTAAATAGLGSVATTWGCNGTCGTGFTLPGAETLVGMYISSNVNISVTVSAFKSGVLLGSQTVSPVTNQIQFVGFSDPGGIDKIVIGNNTLCPNCIHQLDSIMFQNAAAATATGVPTLSEWSLIILSSLLALGTMLALRRRRQ